MRRSLLAKFVVTAILALGLIFPLSAIVGMVHDRQAASIAVLRDVQQTGVGAQTVTGPILIVPYRRTVSAEVTDPQTGKKSIVTTRDGGRLHFLPDALTIDARVGTEMRHRGIYSALLYDAQQQISGSFNLPANYGVTAGANFQLFYQKSFLLPHRRATWIRFAERLDEAAEFADRVGAQGEARTVLDGVGVALHGLAGAIAARID